MRGRWLDRVGAAEAYTNDGPAALLNRRRPADAHQARPRRRGELLFGERKQLEARVAPAAVGAALQLLLQVDRAIRATGARLRVIRAGIVKRQAHMRGRVLDGHQLHQEFADLVLQRFYRHTPIVRTWFSRGSRARPPARSRGVRR